MKTLTLLKEHTFAICFGDTLLLSLGGHIKELKVVPMASQTPSTTRSGLRFTLERDAIGFESEEISCGLRSVFDSLPDLNEIVHDMQSPSRGAPSEMIDELCFGDFAPLVVQGILNVVIGRSADTLKRAYVGKGKEAADLGQNSGTSRELPEIEILLPGFHRMLCLSHCRHSHLGLRRWRL
jgi:hypothetical protein